MVDRVCRPSFEDLEAEFSKMVADPSRYVVMKVYYSRKYVTLNNAIFLVVCHQESVFLNLLIELTRGSIL